MTTESMNMHAALQSIRNKGPSTLPRVGFPRQSRSCLVDSISIHTNASTHTPLLGGKVLHRCAQRDFNILTASVIIVATTIVSKWTDTLNRTLLHLE